jgi:hypothetical protein
MATMKVLFIILLLLVLGGCDPYRFNMLGYNKLKGRIHAPLESVDVSERYFDLKENGCVALELPTATQYSIAFYAKRIEGEGFRILARSRVEETVIDSGVIVTISKNYARADKDNINLSTLKSPGFNDDNVVYVNLYNDEKYLQVVIGCDTLLKYFPKENPAPDDIVISSIGQSTIRIYTPEWKDLEVRE